MDTGPSHTWRYVVSRSCVDSETLFQIRELYPTEDGEFGYTAGPVAPSGESRQELLADLERMRADAGREILDLTGPEPRLVPVTDRDR
jgi:hypothetical protein